MSSWRLDLLQSTGNDATKWHEFFVRLDADRRDVHYAVDYARIYELTYGQQAFLAVYGDNDNYIIMPFMLRDIAKLPFMEGWNGNRPVYDIASPYGYGGALVQAKNESTLQGLYRGFFENFHNCCQEQGIVSEFASLHPLLANHRPLQDEQWVQLTRRKPVVYIDLHQDEEGLWRGLCRGHRSSVKKARRAGVRVAREPVAGEVLTEFRRLYADTMKRNLATERWLFPEGYFSNCAACLGDSQISLFTASWEGVTVASYLIIHAYQTVYYHFGGSAANYFDLRANNLLMYEIILWSWAQGYRWFHLGGGYQPGDGLLRFKAGFSNDVAWLYTYGLVHDNDLYRRLCARKDAWDRKHGVVNHDPAFFPAYRR